MMKAAWVRWGVVLCAVIAMGAVAQVTREEFDQLRARVDVLAAEHAALQEAHDKLYKDADAAVRELRLWVRRRDGRKNAEWAAARRAAAGRDLRMTPSAARGDNRGANPTKEQMDETLRRAREMPRRLPRR